MILPIVTYGDPILRKKCNNVKEITENIIILINDMFDTLKNTGGVGLSANQVNIPLNIFIVNYEYNDDFISKVFINPNIIEYSDDKQISKEGCLSFPSLYDDVSRSSSIKIEYQDIDFNNKVDHYSGDIARIIQHEYDHLKGVLFIDKINPLKRKIISSKLKSILKKKIHTNYLIK
ncbi:peptide deformylase [Trichloromonas sp.]|uniref:peptide deformylase n=1 Tax=Trichloromonas sp. TaxID=3069249 RepID=UPI002A3C7C58|nr:peptide deformylase [Trichloromonas sp.]